MKIIHLVLGKANPDRMNGVNKVAHQLALHQHMLGHDVYVYGITHDVNGEIPNRQYKTKLFQANNNKLQIDKALKADLLNLSSFDTIVHCHAGFIPEFYLITRLLVKLKIQYIITPHGNFMKGALDKNKWLKLFYFKIFESKILINAKKVHCLGDGENLDLLKLDKRIKTEIVPNGQDQSGMDVKQWSNIQSTLTFGYCGRFTKAQKGLDILLHGFEIYKNVYLGSGKLSMIGDGDYLKKFISLAVAKGLDKDITVWGGLFGEQKNKVMQQMDVFCHTSRNEGMPMAVLEASSMGIPCLVSEFTNMTSYLKKYNAGYCLQLNTPEEVALMMAKAEKDHKDAKLQQLGINAQKMIEQEFNWNSISKRLIEIYK